MNKKGSILVLSGPSGSGKNTVYDGLREKSDNIVQTVSVTTRAPREGEVDGRDYYFVTEKEFLTRIDNDEFIEYVNYGKNYYGTLKSEVLRLTEAGKTVILVIEVNGALNIKKAFPEACSVFIIPPSTEELRRRITSRGQNTEEEINTRLSIAEQEMKMRDHYDYCVVNDRLEDCVEEIYKIIKNNIK